MFALILNTKKKRFNFCFDFQVLRQRARETKNQQIGTFVGIFTQPLQKLRLISHFRSSMINHF